MIVEGLVPALSSQNVLSPIRTSIRKIHAKQFQDFKSYNCIENDITNRQTVIDLNHLDDSVLHAQTVDCFGTVVHQQD